ncbi:MAG: ABC transporter ATP-binding protein [Proteobacteria bacterium]|nr:ABC transporter ATP-binding protein [Pseudomonadota bacterium]
MLRIDNVSVKFAARNGQAVSALSDISLDIPDREFSVIVGPSGCGKTTLLRIVAGLQRQTAGTIALDGAPITGPSVDRGMVFQSYTLFPWLTVKDNVKFGLRLKSMPAARQEEIAQRFIARMGLEGFESAYSSQLSGGMKQRVAIARALANDPKILLMDEPFGALDSQTRGLMQEMLTGIWERDHKTVLFITHDIEEAVFLADRVHVMTARPGRIKRQIDVALKRPRTVEMRTSPEFVALKREVLALLHDEAILADRGRPNGGA